MIVDAMRVPFSTDFFSDPPFGFFDVFHRPRREHDSVVREIPIQFEPFTVQHNQRWNRATQGRSPDSDFDADIPDEFWEPVLPQKVDSSTKPLKRKGVEETEEQGNEAFVDLSDEAGSYDVNNSGVIGKCRRRSLSRSRKHYGSKKSEFRDSCPGASPASSQNCGNKDKKDQNKMDHSAAKDLEEAGFIKPTFENTNDRKTDCIEIDSLEEASDYQDLCDFFGCDGNIKKTEKASRNDSNIRPCPSYPAYETIRTILDKEHRCVDYIQGDGNCFFRSLSKVIYGSESCHSELRQAVVDLLEKFPREFEQFIDGSVHEHIKNMRKEGTWATQTEIYVAATLLQRDIYILSPDHTGDVYRWLLFSPRFSYKEAAVYDRCYLTLCHTNGNHYDRIALVGKSCNCFAPPPQLMGIREDVDLIDEVV